MEHVFANQSKILVWQFNLAYQNRLTLYSILYVMDPIMCINFQRCKCFFGELINTFSSFEQKQHVKLSQRLKIYIYDWICFVYRAWTRIWTYIVWDKVGNFFGDVTSRFYLWSILILQGLTFTLNKAFRNFLFEFTPG